MPFSRCGNVRRKEPPCNFLPSCKEKSITRLLQGAFVGFAATALIGFTWGGWTLGKTANEMAEKRATAAVVTALAPICVDNFRRAVDAKANLAELTKITSWQQGSFVEKGGWATLPGSDAANSAVARACADVLTSVK